MKTTHATAKLILLGCAMGEGRVKEWSMIVNFGLVASDEGLELY